MPRVPTARERGVAPAAPFVPLRGAPTAEQLGAGLGEEIQRTGSLLQQEGLARQQQKIETEAKDADNQLAEGIRDIMHNPQTGLLAKSGQAAIEAQEDTRKQIEDLRKQIAGGMNGAARRLFDPVAARRVNGTQGQIGDHIIREQERFKEQTFVARVDNAIADAAGDPRYTERALGLIEDEIQQRVEDPLNPMPQEQADKMKREATSAVHEAVVERMLASDNPTGALGYVQGAGKDIDPKKRAAFERRARVEVDKRKALNMADAVFSDDADLKEMTDAIRKRTKDPEIRADAIAEVTSRFRINDASRRAEEQRYYEETADQVEDGAITSLSQIDKTKLSNAQYTTLRKRLQGEIESKPVHEAVAAVMQEIAEDPRGFAERDFVQHRLSFGPEGATEFNHWDAVHKRMRQGLEPDDLPEVRNVRAAMDLLKAQGHSKKQLDRLQFGVVRLLRQERERKKGVPLSLDEVQATIARATQEFESGGGFLGLGGTTTQLELAAGVDEIESVPDAIQQRIIATIERENARRADDPSRGPRLDPSDEELVRGMYAEGLVRGTFPRPEE